RFHSEAPPTYFTRNFGKFARTTANVADAARLMAIIYVGYADAIEACVEAKYFYEAWRPLSAIPLADTDNNPATAADPGWTPSVPTPNHPEYPAAHSCSAGALGELLRQYYRTEHVSYTFDSIVTGTSRTYTKTDGLAEESRLARIYGGMHFRNSTTAGAELGKQVANWTLQHRFGNRD
ncbi:MAG: phosphatase family protein, partial [Massilia sp.]|nr:phosphatase family protein [Massilia sp.]